MATIGMGLSSVSAPTNAPGVNDKAVKIGFISAQTGVAASVGKNTARACNARVDAQNASGGVNGRKIDLLAIDDTSSSANLTAAKDLVENENVFAVIDQSPLGFLSYRYLQEEGVPRIGSGTDGTFYGEKGNEDLISSLGNGAPVTGFAYDSIERMMKKMGAKTVAAVGYGSSPGSSDSARSAVKYGAPAVGLESGYLNTTVEFGTTDVGSLVLGIKNSGSDGLYLPLVSDTNFAIVQGLQQNNVNMKSIVMATGYSQDLLDQPIAETIEPNTVMLTAFRPVELGGAAVKKFRSNLQKYAGITGVPDFGTYASYIACDMMIQGLKAAGKSPTRRSFLDAVRGIGKYDGAGLTCGPIDVSRETFGQSGETQCAWFVGVKDGKFVVLNNGRPITGKLIGDPEQLAQNKTKSITSTTTTTAPPTTDGARGTASGFHWCVAPASLSRSSDPFDAGSPREPGMFGSGNGRDRCRSGRESA